LAAVPKEVAMQAVMGKAFRWEPSDFMHMVSLLQIDLLSDVIVGHRPC